MTYSKVSDRRQRSVYGCAGSVVVPDRGGEGEHALQDADPGAAGSVTAVAFEVELAFEGLADRFDDLAQRGARAAVTG